MTERIARKDARRRLLEDTRSGHVFSARHTKKDGTVRDGRYRSAISMSKGKTGKGLSYDPIEKGLLPVYDMTKAREGEDLPYRMLNMNTVERFCIDGNEYEVID